jgi:hypothetical protein
MAEKYQTVSITINGNTVHFAGPVQVQPEQIAKAELEQVTFSMPASLPEGAKWEAIRPGGAPVVAVLRETVPVKMVATEKGK